MPRLYPNLDSLQQYAEQLAGKIARPEPERGRYGWYKIVDKSTGEVREYRRATTLSGKLDDKSGLVDWKARKAVEGVVRHSGLAAEIAQFDIDPADRESKWQLNELIEQACGISGGSDGSNAGTALHGVFEAHDLGLDPQPPDPYRRDVLARGEALKAAGLVIDPSKVELIIVNEALNVCGMADRLVLDPQGKFRTAASPETYVVFDDKTGATLHPLAFAAQMGIYAHGTYAYDPTTHDRLELPPIDSKVGIICHTPAGGGVSTLYAVDIEAGYELLGHLMDIEGGRLSWKVGYACGAPKEEAPATVEAATVAMVKAAFPGAEEVPCLDDAAEVLAPPAPKAHEPKASDPFAGIPGEDGKPQADRLKKRAWLEGRIATLRAVEGGLEALQAAWPAEVPPFKRGDREGHEYVLAELEAITTALDEAEKAVRAPFPATVDPTDPTLIRVPGSDPRVIALRDRFVALPADLRAKVQMEQAQHGIPRLTSGRATEDHLVKADALILAAEETFMARAKRLTETLHDLAERGVSEAAALRAIGAQTVLDVHGQREEFLRLLMGTVKLGWTVERDGALVVDRPVEVLDLYNGSRQALWRAAKAEAKARGLDSPASSDAALSDPILVACLGAA